MFPGYLVHYLPTRQTLSFFRLSAKARVKRLTIGTLFFALSWGEYWTSLYPDENNEEVDITVVSWGVFHFLDRGNIQPKFQILRGSKSYSIEYHLEAD